MLSSAGHITPAPRTWRASLLAGVLAGSCTITACGDEGGPTPPDGADCTVGTLVVGVQAGGTIAASDCTVASELRSRPRIAQSWTLDADAGSFYIVRLNPQGTLTGMDLVAELEGPDGEPALATAGLNKYRENGEPVDHAESIEMWLPSDRDQEISVRVEADAPAVGQAYTLSLFRCPITTLPPGVQVDSIAIDGSCQLLAYPSATTPVEVAVLGYRIDAAGEHAIGAEPVATGPLVRGFLGGPGLDISWTHPSSVIQLLGSAPTLSVDRIFNTPGTYTLVVGVATGSTMMINAKAAPSAAVPVARR